MVTTRSGDGKSTLDLWAGLAILAAVKTLRRQDDYIFPATSSLADLGHGQDGGTSAAKSQIGLAVARSRGGRLIRLKLLLTH